MRHLFWVAILLLFGTFAASAQCSSDTRIGKIGRQQVIKLQQFVNEGHQPWRLDSQAVAAATALQLDNASRQESSVYAVPSKLLSQSENQATYEIKGAQPGITYRITVARFDWLLPSAQKWEWMVWTETQVQMTRCK
jgi:hypothetical protein